MISFIRNHSWVVTFLIVFGLVTFCAYHAYQTYNKPATGIDDANITFVYARNFAQGYGFVYNIGGEKVEGFTSMLWTLVTSVFFFFLNSPERFILYFNILIVSVGLTAIIMFLNRFFEDKIYKKTGLFSLTSVIFLLWILTSLSFIVWSIISLMEVGLYSVIYLLLTLLIFKIAEKDEFKKEIILLSLLEIFLVLIRPESLLIAPVSVGLVGLIVLLKRKNLFETIKTVAMPTAAVIITIVGLTGFRLLYFGYPFPNTYYAKVSSDSSQNIEEGKLYFENFLNSNVFATVTFWAAVLLVIFVLIRLIRTKINTAAFDLSRLEMVSLVLGVITLLGFGIPIYAGGDHFAQFRFYQHLWPLLILSPIFLYKLSIDNDLKITKVLNFERLTVAIVLITICFVTAGNINWTNIKQNPQLSMGHEFTIAENDRATAGGVGDFFNPAKTGLDRLPSLGALTAGGLKFSYPGEVIDLLGLNNTLIAHASSLRTGPRNHAAFDKDSFFILKPDIIHAGFTSKEFVEIPGPAIPGGFWFAAFKGIQKDPEFLSLYTPAVVKNIETDVKLFGFYRNEFLDKVRQIDTFKVITDELVVQ